MSDLTQIQTFIEVANGKGFAEAGRKLSIPRSTASARIQSLEKRLGVRLFHRNTRRVSLTNEGLEYFDQCQQAMALLENAEEKFSNTHTITGKLRLTVPVAIPMLPLAELLSAFNVQHPELIIEIIVSDESLDLISNNIDLAIRGNKPGDMDLIARSLGDNPVKYLASPTFLTQNSGTTEKQLLQHNLIFSPANDKETATLKTKSFELAKALAIHNKGIVALPLSVCEAELKSGQLAELKISKEKNVSKNLSVYLVYSNRIHMPKRLRLLIDFIADNGKGFGIV